MQQIPLLPVFRVLKAADETVNNSSTYQDDNEIKFRARAQAKFLIQFMYRHNTGATPDIKFQWAIPSGAAIEIHAAHNNAGGSSVNEITAGNSLICRGIGTVSMGMAWCWLTTAATAGAVTLQWAQATANASDTKVLAGSFIIVQQIDPVPVIPGLAHAPTR